MRKLIAVGLLVSLLAVAGCADEPDVEPGAADSDVTEDVADFDTLDANEDSSLDADELAEWTDDVGTFEEWDIDSDSELDTDEISRNTFEVWDQDRDGIISEEEWQRSAQTWYPNDPDLIVFQDVDGDGDSEIDADEFAEGFDFSVLGESWTSDSLDKEAFGTAYFELFDADNDGQVSEAEWESGFAIFGTPDSV